MTTELYGQTVIMPMGMESLNTSFASSTTTQPPSDESASSAYEGVALVAGDPTHASPSTLNVINAATEKTNESPKPEYTAEYLAQLIKDKKQLAAFPGIFVHVERIIDDEVKKVRVALFQFAFSSQTDASMALPDAVGIVQTISEKVFVPSKEYPDYNFVGRILGPRGMTAKQLEQETGCKIMVRGRGSMRDKKKEETNRGKPNWEHLNDELHVLVQCEDTANRASVKLQRAIAEVKKLLVPAPEGEDELKRKQLMELAIINGTYRPANQRGGGANMSELALTEHTDVAVADAATARQLLQTTMASSLQSQMGAPLILGGGRTPASMQTPYQQALYLAQQQQAQAQAQVQVDSTALAQQQLLMNQMAMGDTQQMAHIAAQQAAYFSTSMLGGQPDYAAQLAELQNSNAMLQQRRYLGAARDNPYQRVNGSQ